MNLSTEKKIMDIENKLVVAKREGEREGGTRNLGLMQTIAFAMDKQWGPAM